MMKILKKPKTVFIVIIFYWN